MAEFFAWGNESVNLDNVTQAKWETDASGLAGLIKLYCGGQQHAISFESPDIERVAALVGFGDKLKALFEARKAKAAAVEDQKAARVEAGPLAGGLGRKREPAKV